MTSHTPLHTAGAVDDKLASHPSLRHDLQQQQQQQQQEQQTNSHRRVQQSDNSTNNDDTADELQSTYQCTTPPPHLIPIYNSTSDSTTYVEYPVQVFRVEVFFDYEIRHASEVVWSDSAVGTSSSNGGNGGAEGGEDGEGGFTGFVGDIVGNIFGSKNKDVDTPNTSTSETNNGAANGTYANGGNMLHRLEKVMVAQVWDQIMKDENMTFVEGTASTSGTTIGDCSGLVIQESTRRRLDGGADRLLEGNGTDADTDDIVNITDIVEEEDDVVDAEEEDTMDDNEGMGGSEADLSAAFSETKLLGLSVDPPDVVDTTGCINPSSQCTAIHGSISAIYTGTNEYGVAKHITRLIQSGCETGLFLSSTLVPAALMIEFRNSVEADFKNSGTVLAITTDPQNETSEEEEDYISKYGIMFVCFLAVLGVGFIAAMMFKRKKRKDRRMNQRGEMEGEEDLRLEVENGNATAANSTAHLEAGEEDIPMKKVDLEEVSELETGVAVATQQVGEEDAISEDGGFMNNVELDVPATDSSEVEISFSPGRSSSRKKM